MFANLLLNSIRIPVNFNGKSNLNFTKIEFVQKKKKILKMYDYYSVQYPVELSSKRIYSVVDTVLNTKIRNRRYCQTYNTIPCVDLRRRENPDDRGQRSQEY